MANLIKMKRSSTTETLPTVEFGEVVLTDVSNVLKLHGTGSDNTAHLLITQPPGGTTTFWRADGTWAAPAGSGNVSNTGTPVDGQLAVWTDATTIEGDANLTFDTTTDTLSIGASGNLAFGAVTVIDDTAGSAALQNIDSIDATTGTSIDTQIGSNYATSAQGTLADSAVQPGDTDASALGWVDNGTVSTGSSTKVPTQSAVKSYVDAVAASEMTYLGGFDPTAGAGSGSPDLDAITSAVGDMYTVTVAGTYNWTTGSATLEVGDVLIAETNGVLNDVANWTIINKNLGSVVPDARQLTPGTGILLDGANVAVDLSADRTIAVDLDELTTVTDIDGATEFLVKVDAAGNTEKVLGNYLLDGGTFS